MEQGKRQIKEINISLGKTRNEIRLIGFQTLEEKRKLTLTFRGTKMDITIHIQQKGKAFFQVIKPLSYLLVNHTGTMQSLGVARLEARKT